MTTTRNTDPIRRITTKSGEPGTGSSLTWATGQTASGTSAASPSGP